MNIYPPIDWTQYPLHTAAMSGNKAEVERLIAQHAEFRLQAGRQLEIVFVVGQRQGTDIGRNPQEPEPVWRRRPVGVVGL